MHNTPPQQPTDLGIELLLGMHARSSTYFEAAIESQARADSAYDWWEKYSFSEQRAELQRGLDVASRQSPELRRTANSYFRRRLSIHQKNVSLKIDISDSSPSLKKTQREGNFLEGK
ncbi:hypothetical protein EDD37DRAFT_610180 [Exophiala viscosa]|uniref:uncharacterized protein n=1 Tax=Exophiala viscosa TaxID=2486360 RepID=UPI00219375D4|nr:hypothetical protein EDD37DRAFT_610180 [Exophiala viscosa]